MITLGFNGTSALGDPDGHDTSAALVIDGKIIAAAEQERFDRNKHSNCFPIDAIRYCLDVAGINPNEIDAFCFYWDPNLHYLNTIKANMPGLIFGHLRDAEKITQKRNAFSILENELGITLSENKRRFVSHHLCHAASAFYTSPWEQAAYLTVDGLGELNSSTYGIGNTNGLQQLHEIMQPTSLGLFYMRFTNMLGFRGLEDEYKVMGLASYGDPTYFRTLFNALWRKTDTGIIHLSDEAAVDAIIQLNKYRRSPHEELSTIHKDLAAALQECLEQQLIHLAQIIQQRTQQKNLCLSGGVALNSTANGKLARAGIFEDVFIQPAANDGGAALGAALYVNAQLCTSPPKKQHFSVRLGPAYDNLACQNACDQVRNEINIEYPTDFIKDAAQRLANGEVIGWFQGRMEFGPRALGGRSILADPRNEKMRDRINQAVKHRELFRPFAPVVLEEVATHYFEMGSISSTPHMTMTFIANFDTRAEIPAVVHRDGTSRVQTVNEKDDPLLNKLLHAFGKLTGVPVLLNTSFNIRGEPIVCSPTDALECFLSTDLNALILGETVITRRDLSGHDWDNLRPKVRPNIQLHTNFNNVTKNLTKTVLERLHFKTEATDTVLWVLKACNGLNSVSQIISRWSQEQSSDETPTITIHTALRLLLKHRYIHLENEL